MNFSIGDYSSLASLILFVLYLLGRLWAAQKSVSLISDKFRVAEIPDKEHFETIRNVIVIDDPGETIFSITSQYPLIKLQVRPYRFQNVIGGERKDKVTHKMLRPIYTVGMISAETPIYFQSNLAECIPHYLIWFQRSDYVKGSFLITYNTREGGLCPVDYQLKHTLRSLLYYFCK